MGKEPSFWRSACDMDDLRERDIILALFRKRALLLQGSPTTGGRRLWRQKDGSFATELC